MWSIVIDSGVIRPCVAHMAPVRSECEGRCMLVAPRPTRARRLAGGARRTDTRWPALTDVVATELWSSMCPLGRRSRGVGFLLGWRVSGCLCPVSRPCGRLWSRRHPASGSIPRAGVATEWCWTAIASCHVRRAPCGSSTAVCSGPPRRRWVCGNPGSKRFGVGHRAVLVLRIRSSA